MDSRLNCPSCGGEIRIVSSATVFVTCSYCQSTLIRDKDWSLRGKVADLPPELTHLQVGTTGTYEGRTFELIGRRRMSWEDGFWTEWCARFAHDEMGWLAEAQGSLAMGFEADVAVELPDGLSLRPGTEIPVGSFGRFSIDDTKKARVVGTEGEMPYLVDPGESLLTVDASNYEGGFCSFEWNFKVQRWSVFIGRYLDFAEFHFQNLRQLDGW
jgi:hypothetical protein